MNVTSLKSNFPNKIIFFDLKSQSNVINKKLVKKFEFSLTLTRDVNLIRPVLRLYISDEESELNYNYCQIPDLKRYYFIDSVISLGNNIFELHLLCDVLTTYKDQILSLNALVTRNIQNGDYFNGFMQSDTKSKSTIHKSNVGLNSEYNYILATIGG